ncbi:TonB-dependent receptor [Sphingomonas gilva]|uniref:TonB-dependent receptor n=1 Tax=Sphingomonas gilva TaxID=2305907 RepID=A0A396RKJ3_9SPHN|nr:TonB-dependent receptor [Sphingomonas gilva]RHW16797.1 TonB-dependent receptor [Sphingomonas gilva]
MRNYLFAGAAAAALMVPASAYAQQITSGIQGTVVDGAGQPLAGVEVTVTDTRTGTSRTLVTGADGSFSTSGLVVGGPYTVSASSAGFGTQTIENITTTLQGNSRVDLQLASGGEDIVVTASRGNVSQLATGPGQSFSAEVINALPSFDRDIRDILRVDPRVSLERNLESDRVSCLGGNDRSNAFTVDGISQGDNYGLTDTPFSSRSGAPIPFGAISETSVQFAPFDVEYGSFTGCAINVVTKSGSNAFHGDAFFQYGDTSLAGDNVAGRPAKAAADDIRYGGSLGGPIIPDRLFFFGAYEHSEVTLAQDDGPSGGGFPNERAFITVEQFNEISEVLSSVYGRDTLGIVRDRPTVTDRYFGRLDWYITDDHRLEATYQRTEENSVRADDFSSTNFTGLDNFQNSGSTADYGSVRLYSRWSDVFSTELRYSRSEITDIQGPVGGGEAQDENPLTRIVVGVRNDDDRGLFISGPGFSRTANDLYTTIDQYKAKGLIDAGAHQITIGAELNTVNFDNLFVQNATGTLYFADVDALREGLLNAGTSTSVTTASAVGDGTTIGAEGAFSRDGNVNTARAKFSRSIYSAYAQDVWQASDALELTAGVRVEWYDGDHPDQNDNFVARYGFSNNTGFSNLEPVLLPRLAFNYDLGDFGFLGRAQVKGGVGIFSGGDPGVWFGNAFQNNGFGFASGNTNDAPCPGGQIDVVENGQFTGAPTCFRDAAITRAAAGLGDTQSIDPDIEIPTVVRANLGFEAQLGSGDGFFSGWNLNLDYIYSHYRKALTVVDLSQTIDIRRGVDGFTVDGQPIFGAIDPTAAGCDAVLAEDGVDIRWEGVTAACFSTSRDDEIQLTNGRSYNSHIGSLLLSKNFDRGVFTEGGNVFVNFGYAYTDSNDRRNMFNSTATSNYDLTAATNLQDPPEARGFYETRHSITFAANFSEQFFGDDLDTSLGFTFVAHSGRPYSLTFGGSGGFFDSASGFDNRLLYIPTGVDDPNLSDSSNDDAVADFVSYVDGLECAREAKGRIIERNTCTNDWYYDLDLNFSQELPGPLPGDSIKLTVLFDNFLNFLNSDWNVRRTRNFAGLVNVVSPPSGSPVDSEGKYIINSFQPDDANDITSSASLWRLKFGVSYQF